MDEMGFITPLELREALQKQEDDWRGRKLGDILIQLDYATPEHVSQALARQQGHPWVNLKRMDIEDRVLALHKRADELGIAFVLHPAHSSPHISSVSRTGFVALSIPNALFLSPPSSVAVRA